MAKMKGPNDPAGSEKRRRKPLSQTLVPSYSLKEALRIPQAIWDNYAGKPTKPLGVAKAIGMTPTSGPFRTISGSAIAYGLTEGGAQGSQISLTGLGRRIVAPKEEGDDLIAQREAFLKPGIIGKCLRTYDGKPFPNDAVAKNVLEDMGVPRESVDRVLALIVDEGTALGLITEIKGKKFVQLEGVEPTLLASDDDSEEDLEGFQPKEDHGSSIEGDEAEAEAADAPARPAKIRPIFVGHGKNKAPLSKLESMLKKLQIDYRIAVEEPSLGRPIPTKVRQIMSECGSAILLFTKDEKFQDEQGNEVWRPRENVVYELGAASFAYEDKIVIMKEDGLDFPTNYESIGRIEFETNNIEAKSMELLQELIGFGLVKVITAGE